MFKYIIVTEDGDVFGLNDDELAGKWSEGKWSEETVVINRELCKYESGGYWEDIDPAPDLDAEEE